MTGIGRSGKEGLCRRCAETELCRIVDEKRVLSSYGKNSPSFRQGEKYEQDH